MLKSDAAAYLAGVTQVEGAQASAPTNLHVITGEVGQNSEDGKTTVSVDGLVFSEEDSQEIEMDTLGGLEEGDIATIILTGEAGHGMTPLAIGAVGSVDRINAKVIETQLLLADKADIQDLTAATARIDDLEADHVTVNDFTAATGRIGDLEADNVTINGRLQAAELDIDGIQADYLKAADLQAEQARVGNLLANKADVSDLTAATGRISDLEADHVTVTDFTAATGRIDDLEADHVTVNDFTAATGRIDDLEADHIGTADLEAEQARVDNLLANKANVSDLNAAKGRISDLEADHVSVADFQAEQANIDTLQANTADIATIRANSAKVQNLTAAQLEADHATIGTLDTTYATIANLNAANGRITNLESTKANISDLEANYITADEIEATYMHANMSNSDVAWIENGTIKNGAIVSAMINDVSANKLTAGTINGSVINVTNLNADNITTGTINGQRIGEGSLSLSKLDESVYTEAEVNSIVDGLNDRIDGAIETFTGTVVPTLNNSPASSWNTTKLRDEHVGDVYYVVNSQSQQNGYCYRFTKSGSTYSWQLIKDSDVTAALQRISAAEGKITTFDSDISTLKTDTGTLTTRTTNLETRADDVDATLLDKVDVTTFNEVSDTVDAHTQTISQHTTAISNKADSSTVTAVTNRVSKNEQDISGINTTIGELQDTVETKADGSTVSTISSKLNTVSDTVDGHTQAISSVQNTLSTKADSSTVSTLTTKVNTVSDTVDGHTQRLSSVEDTLETKADSSTVSTLTTKVNNVSDTVDGHTSQLTSITSTQTSMQSTLDKTVKSSIQLWYSKANTTAPSKPTSQVTSTSTSGNAWRIVVPAYNASYPHYYYCWQYEYTDGTYGWSAVVRDIAMGESQATARTADSNASAAVTTANTASTNASTALTTANTASTNASEAKTAATTASTTASEAKTTAETAASDASTAKTNAASAVTTANSASTTATNAQTTANANIKSSVQLWFTKANSTAPSKPTSVVSTSNANTANAWNLVVPVWNSSYPHYFYCYQQQKGDGTYQWTDVVYDRATSEAQQLANTTSTNLSTLQTNYATFKQTTEQFESTVGSRLTTIESDIDGVEERVSDNETSISNNASAIALKANSTDVYTKTAVDGKITQEVNDRNSAIEQSASAINLSVSQNYTTKTEFNNLEIGGRNLLYKRVSAGGRVTANGDYSIILNASENLDTYFTLYTRNQLVEGATYVISCEASGINGDGVFYKFPLFRQGSTIKSLVIDKNGINSFSFVMNATELGYHPARTVDDLTVYAVLMDDVDRNIEGQTGPITLTNFKLEKGNKPTDWTPAPEDMVSQTEFTEAKSEIKQTTDGIASTVSKISGIKYLESVSAGWPLRNIKTYAAEGVVAPWIVVSSDNVRVGDAILIKGYDTTRQCNVYVKGTVNSISGNTLNITAHGYEDVLPSDVVISSINQSAESVKIQASRVEIDGTATFNAIKPSTDAAYDAKGSAATVQSNLDNIVIGGRNLLAGTDVWLTTFNSYSTCGKGSETIPAGSVVTVSVEVDADNLVWDTTSSTHRIGFETYLTKTGGGYQYFGVWAGNAISESSNVVEAFTGSIHKRISKTFTLLGDFEVGRSGYVYTQGVAQGTVKVGRAKIEYGNRATDWSPSEGDIVKRTQRIYYRWNSATAPSAPTTWVTKGDDGSALWTKMHVAITSTHKFIYTCEQYEMADGTLGHTDVLLDNTITVIDGGNIITGSVYATALNAADINASKTLTVGAMTDAAAATILNSNVRVGGRNLLVNTGNYATWDMAGSQTITRYNDCIKFTPPASAQWWTIEPHEAYIPLSDWDTSASYTVSIDVKFDNLKSASDYPIVALETVKNNTTIGYSARVRETGLQVVPTTNDWTHFEYTFSGDYSTWNMRGSGTPAYIKVLIWLYLSSSNADAVSFRNLKLEKGNKGTDWSPAPEDSLAEEQYIYISSASGTTSINKNTTWVTQSSDVQNVWTTKRPTYNSSYPVLFVAKQSKTVGGSVSCTTPVKDDTTTVIDGAHITTGTIDTNRLNADTIKSNIVQTTNLSATQITSGDISADRIKANVIGAINSLTAGQINAERVNATNLHVDAANIDGTISIGKLPSTVAQKSDVTSAVDAIAVGGRNLFALVGSVAGYMNAAGSVTEGQSAYKERTTDYIAIDASTQYTVQAWYDTSNPTSSYMWLCLSWYTSEKAHISQPLRVHMTSSNYESWVFTSPSNAAYARISARWVESGYLYGKVKLEKGNKPTDWTPAPEDVDADISEAAKTATNYITADSSGIKIADASPSSATTYLHLASRFLDFIRGGTSMLKAWLDGSVAKVRVGAEQIDGTDTFNTLTDNEGIKLRRGTTVLSQFATNLIELGKNSYNATISLLNNGIEIYATDIDPDHRVHFGRITSGDSYLQFAPWSTVEGDESAYSASAKFGVKHEFTSTRGFGVDDSVNIGGDGFVGLTTALVDSDDVPLAEAGMYAATNMVAGNSEIAIIGDKVFLYDGGGNTSTYYGPFPMSDVASAIPVTLYDNASASASAAATLSETAANFKRLTIFFKDTDGNYSSTEVWSPNGKRVALSLTWINGASTQDMYQRVRWVTISGTTISTYKGRSDSKYRTGQVKLGATASVANSDYLAIVHVIGYR